MDPRTWIFRIPINFKTCKIPGSCFLFNVGIACFVKEIKDGFGNENLFLSVLNLYKKIRFSFVLTKWLIQVILQIQFLFKSDHLSVYLVTSKLSSLSGHSALNCTLRRLQRSYFIKTKRLPMKMKTRHTKEPLPSKKICIRAFDLLKTTCGTSSNRMRWATFPNNSTESVTSSCQISRKPRNH